MVTEVSEEMPSLINTFFKVSTMISASNLKLIFSTYQTSYSNFCSQLMAFLPFTCAQPVMPGLTSCRLFCRELYKDKYSANKGLGPIRLISPLITFNNWGISSKEVLRMNLPISVNRSESGNKLPFLSRLSFMVLNFMIRNIFSFLPGRDWMKKGCPWLDIRRKMVIRRKTGERMMRAKRDMVKSMRRLRKCLYMLGIGRWLLA